MRERENKSGEGIGCMVEDGHRTFGGIIKE